MCTGYVSACLHMKAILEKGCKSYTEKKYFQTWKYYGIVILEQLFLNIVQLYYSDVDH